MIGIQVIGIYSSTVAVSFCNTPGQDDPVLALDAGQFELGLLWRDVWAASGGRRAGGDGASGNGGRVEEEEGLGRDRDGES